MIAGVSVSECLWIAVIALAVFKPEDWQHVLRQGAAAWRWLRTQSEAVQTQYATWAQNWLEEPRPDPSPSQQTPPPAHKLPAADPEHTP